MGMLKPPLIERHNAWEHGDARGTTPQQSRTPRKVVTNVQDRDRRDATPARKSSASTPSRDGRQIWYPDPSTVDREKRRREERETQAVQAAAARAEQRVREHAGILQRQRDSEEEARAARRQPAYDAPPASQSTFVSMPVPNATPQRSLAPALSNTSSGFDIPAPPLFPLESPTRHDGDSTDADSEKGNDEEIYRKIADLTMGTQRTSSSSLAPFGGYVFHLTIRVVHTEYSQSGSAADNYNLYPSANS